eukprot:6159577-Amphidinium_carterae.1
MDTDRHRVRTSHDDLPAYFDGTSSLSPRDTASHSDRHVSAQRISQTRRRPKRPASCRLEGTHAVQQVVDSSHQGHKLPAFRSHAHRSESVEHRRYCTTEAVKATQRSTVRGSTTVASSVQQP